MDFDLRTCDAAYYFVLDFMGMTPDEYITERIINCENDFETFWSRNIERIKSVNISGLRLMAFHKESQHRMIGTNLLSMVQQISVQLKSKNMAFQENLLCIYYSMKQSMFINQKHSSNLRNRY